MLCKVAPNGYDLSNVREIWERDSKVRTFLPEVTNDAINAVWSELNTAWHSRTLGSNI